MDKTLRKRIKDHMAMQVEEYGWWDYVTWLKELKQSEPENYNEARKIIDELYVEIGE